MDFALTEEQAAVVELARQILGDCCTPQRLKEVEGGNEWFDRDTWAELAKSDLLGISLPESVGGGGFGFLEVCLLLREAGRTVAPIPLFATVVTAITIAEFGSDEQRARWLPGVIDGSIVLAPALSEVDANLREPSLRAHTVGTADWTLQGVKTAVPAAHLAAALLVPATYDDGTTGVFIVPSDAAGLTIDRQDTFNHEPQFQVTFDGVAMGEGDVLAKGQGPRARPEVADWLIDRATVGICALAAGVSDSGMRITAQYVTERKQFDRPIGSFQAVGHRMADCYIDNEAINLTMLQAASKLAEGMEASKEVSVAKYWASFGGSRIGHADLHLHGGISIDLDYPIHRYFLWSKHLELMLGGGTPQLARLGALLAS